jgi:predicted nucleic acid-binding protein
VNVVDSSCWIEYLGDGPNASEFAPAIEAPDELIVPALTLYEVFKRVCQLKGESVALEAVGLMLQGRVVELSASLAIAAARASIDEGLSMADATILATARSEGATLWTQDAHFGGLDGVEYRAAG